MALLELPGPIVSVAAQGPLLGVVYHASLPDDNQQLACQVGEGFYELAEAAGLESASFVDNGSDLLVGLCF